MANLNVNILGMEFNNPIFTAAGPGAKDGDLCVKAVEGGAGGLVTKTISVDPAPVPRPCMAKTNSGFLNTELWSELPKEQWIEKEYKRAKSAGVPMIVSMGYKAEDIEKIAPLVKPYAGADGLVMINSFGPCMSIDLETGYPIMGSQKGYGWLSGAPIRPLAVRNIYDASRVVNIPIIGVGGVTCGRDAAEMLMAGASAVEVCTEAILKGPGIYGKIAKELNAFLDEHGYKDVKEIIGLSHKKADERTFRTEAIPPVVDNDKCIKCGQCRVSCVYDAITIEDVLKIDEDKCFGCGLCVTRCPKGALTIQYK